MTAADTAAATASPAAITTPTATTAAVSPPPICLLIDSLDEALYRAVSVDDTVMGVLTSPLVIAQLKAMPYLRVVATTRPEEAVAQYWPADWTRATNELTTKHVAKYIAQ